MLVRQSWILVRRDSRKPPEMTDRFFLFFFSLFFYFFYVCKDDNNVSLVQVNTSSTAEWSRSEYDKTVGIQSG